jgi:hypothetical protein
VRKYGVREARKGVEVAETVLMRWEGMGSGDEGTELYDRVHEGMEALATSGQYPGLILHTCSKTDDGIVVVDVWEDAESWKAMFADPAAQAGFQEAGVPQPTSVEILATHNRFRGPSFAAF